MPERSKVEPAFDQPHTVVCVSGAEPGAPASEALRPRSGARCGRTSSEAYSVPRTPQGSRRPSNDAAVAQAGARMAGGGGLQEECAVHVA